MRLVGIDLGQRHVGIAVCDDLVVGARPLETLEVTASNQVARIVEALERLAPTTVVVGLPLLMDGREGTSSRAARKVAKQLALKCRVPVVLEDERLTTTQAHTHRRMSGTRGREGIDSRAAAIVLQTYIDRTKPACPRDDDES